METPIMARKMIMVIGLSLLFFILAGVAYYRSLSVLPFALGAIIGAALSVLKVIMIEHVVKKSASMSDIKDAVSYIRLQYMLRLLFTFAVLTLAAVIPFINLWGTVAGILTLQIATYCMKFYIKNDG